MCVCMGVCAGRVWRVWWRYGVCEYEMCAQDVCGLCGGGTVCVSMRCVCRTCVACVVEVWCVGVSSARISVLFSSVSSWPCLAEV